MPYFTKFLNLLESVRVALVADDGSDSTTNNLEGVIPGCEIMDAPKFGDMDDEFVEPLRCGMMTARLREAFAGASSRRDWSSRNDWGRQWV
jgi:hypothetical protein